MAAEVVSRHYRHPLCFIRILDVSCRYFYFDPHQYVRILSRGLCLLHVRLSSIINGYLGRITRGSFSDGGSMRSGLRQWKLPRHGFIGTTDISTGFQDPSVEISLTSSSLTARPLPLSCLPQHIPPESHAISDDPPLGRRQQSLVKHQDLLIDALQPLGGVLIVNIIHILR